MFRLATFAPPPEPALPLMPLCLRATDTALRAVSQDCSARVLRLLRSRDGLSFRLSPGIFSKQKCSIFPAYSVALRLRTSLRAMCPCDTFRHIRRKAPRREVLPYRAYREHRRERHTPEQRHGRHPTDATQDPAQRAASDPGNCA